MSRLNTPGIAGWPAFCGLLFSALSCSGQAADTSVAPLPLMDCIVTPSDTADVSSAVPGVLESVLVDRSQRVQSGQILAQLESSVEAARLAVSEARARIDAEVHLGQVNQEFDHRRKQRVDSLYRKQAASYQDHDDAAREAALSSWRLLQAREVLKLRELERQQAEAVLRQKTIRSPISGIVTQRYKSPGEYVENQPILRVVKLDPLYVEAIVPMEMHGKVSADMEAEIFLETVSDQSYSADIALIDSMGDAASGTFGVRLVLPNTENRIPAGVRCSVRFVASQGQEELVQTKPVKRLPGEQEKLETTTPLSPGPGQPLTSKAVQSVSRCLEVGPMDSRQEAQGLVSQLRTLGCTADLRETARVVPNSYIVLLQTELPVGDALDELQRLDVHGYAALKHGTYRGRISLGVYNGPISAARRQQQLADVGIDAQVLQRSRSPGNWWISLASPVDGELVASIDSLLEGFSTQPGDPQLCGAQIADPLIRMDDDSSAQRIVTTAGN